MAATIAEVDARPMSAGSHRLVELLLATHQAHEDALRLLGYCGPSGVRLAVRRAEAGMTELAALLLPAIVAYEDRQDRAEMVAHDDFLRSFPDDDPPF